MARQNQNTVPLNIASSDDESVIGMVESVTILPSRLQMAIMSKKPKIEENSNYYYFSTDEQLVYANFYQDFGPLNLAKLYRYCNFLNNALQDEAQSTKTFIYYTRKDPKKILNAAFLIGSYSIIYLRFNVQTVMKALGPILKHANGAKFCDASINDLAYLSLKDCLSGIQKAAVKNFFNFEDFNANDYEYYECVENGDFNWIVPDKLLAFCGPNSRTERTSDSVMLGPEVYIEYFHANNVTVVVRLNSPRYDAHAFTKAGIQHYDLYFSDGSTPSVWLAKQFLKIVENSRGAVAVHCKAGLGRTGTLIGAYLIKHYQFTAMEAIAWLRICRPGSVIGQQQTWLNSNQVQLLQEGEVYRQRQYPYVAPEKHIRGVYSLQVSTESEDTQNVTEANMQCKAITDKEIDSENVQRISQRVDTMCLNDEDEQQESDQVDAASHANNNIVHCKPIRTKKVTKLASRHTRWTRLNSARTILSNTSTTTTTVVRRGRGNVAIPPLGGTQQRASLQETHVVRKKTATNRTETVSAPVVRNQRNASVQTASQGDQLNSIKAARRQHVPTDSIQQKLKNTKIIVPPAATASPHPDNSIRPIASTSVVADTDKGDSVDKAAHTANANLTRKDTMKKNHTGMSSQHTILPSHQFATRVSTHVTQGKEITYEVSLNLGLVVRSLLPGSVMPLMEKAKTSEILLKFVPDCECVVDFINFGVTINMADVLSVDNASTAESQINVVNGNARITKSLILANQVSDANLSTKGTVSLRKETNKTTAKHTERNIPAKLTWLLCERRFTFRVSFDVAVLANTLTNPGYVLGMIRSSTTATSNGQPKRQFKTTVTGTREDDIGQHVHFSLRLNLQKILEKRKTPAPNSGCVAAGKSVPQPCSSKTSKPALCSSNSHATPMEVEDSSYNTLSLDHNGNNATSPAAIQQQIEKQQAAMPRTPGSNVGAEMDARPYKRLRVDVSRL